MNSKSPNQRNVETTSTMNPCTGSRHSQVCLYPQWLPGRTQDLEKWKPNLNGIILLLHVRPPQSPAQKSFCQTYRNARANYGVEEVDDFVRDPFPFLYCRA
jgi:hypothetical protein